MGALQLRRYDSAKVIGEDGLTLRWSRLLKSDLQKLKFVSAAAQLYGSKSVLSEHKYYSIAKDCYLGKHSGV